MFQDYISVSHLQIADFFTPAELINLHAEQETESITLNNGY
jgi:hypothetical protein